MKKSRQIKKFELSTPDDDEPTSKSIRSKKVNSKQTKKENDKLLLYEALDLIYQEHKNKPDDKIRERFQVLIHKPSTIYKKSFSKKYTIKSNDFKKNMQRRITNLVTREGNKMVEDIILKNKK